MSNIDEDNQFHSKAILVLTLVHTSGFVILMKHQPWRALYFLKGKVLGLLWTLHMARAGLSNG